MRTLRKRLCSLLLGLALTLCLLGSLAPAARAAELKTAIGTVNASALRLREGPSTDTAILGTASRNDKVVVIRREGDWYQVVWNLKTGYMHGDYLELDEIKNVKLGYARFDYYVNVRQRPTTESGVAALAPKNETCFIVGFNKGWYKVSYNGTPGYVRSDLVTLLECPYENAGIRGGSSQSRDSGGPLASGSMSKSQKLQLIYGTANVSDYRTVYSSSSEARSHMTTIQIKTWDVNSSGEKYTRTWELTVHKNIAPTVEAIFAEIYALPQKPPIHSIGGYRWDGRSEHSVGLAIDVNANENYYCDPNGNAITGRWFRPDSDPYSIPVGGAVDSIFAKYGFTRGIYWRSGYKDYMHYSLFGT